MFMFIILFMLCYVVLDNVMLQFVLLCVDHLIVPDIFYFELQPNSTIWCAI